MNIERNGKNNTHKLVQIRTTVTSVIELLQKVEQRQSEINAGMAAPVDVRVTHARELLQQEITNTVPDLGNAKN